VPSGFESLLNVVLIDDDGDRPLPKALFLTEFDPKLSTICSWVPKSDSLVVVKGVFSDGLSLLVDVFFAVFDTSASKAARSSCGLVASLLGLLLVGAACDLSLS
jgi:hypothetical protein